MKLKPILAAATLAAACSGAFADDQIVGVSTASPSNFFGLGTLFDGGSDDISFSGLAAGVYNITVTLSGQNVSFDQALSNLNGVFGTAFNVAVPSIAFYNVSYTGASPFALHLFGSDLAGASVYSGDVTVTAVPEPETYALMLAGLGLMGFIARRRRPQ
jgi:hypothetical protein